MSQLDPHPDNLLGKNILDPALEARLITLGYVFAHHVTTPRGRTFLSLYRRPVAETYRSEAEDAYKSLRSRRKQPIAAG